MSNWSVCSRVYRGRSAVAGQTTVAVTALLVVLGIPGVAWGSATCANASLRAGVSASLPDCRAFEQISPVVKGASAAVPISGLPVVTASSGDKVAYLGRNAFPGAVGNTALFVAHVSTRGALGWESTDWTPADPQPETVKVFKADYAFSEDVSQAVVRASYLSLAPGGMPNAYNLFLRHPDGHYTVVNSSPPALPIEAFCGPEELFSCFEFIDVSAIAGTSTDFSHVAFESTAQFTPEAPGPFVENLYDSAEGKVRLVGLLPDGSPASGSTAGSGSFVQYFNGQAETDRRVEHAVSQDGSKIVFQAPADGGEPDPAQAGQQEVYDRVEGRETVELSAPEPGATPEDITPRAATFWAASADGSRVFFTSAADLTSQAKVGSEGGEDLYEYNFNRLAGKKLADLTVDANPVDVSTGAMVQGVVNASSDGSYVYFVAKGDLVSGNGADGRPNLYVVHNGERPVFIATLSEAGGCSFTVGASADACDWTPFGSEREAYVTPDGQHLAFMSTMSLPTREDPNGYSNIDRTTGLADSEVYEYDAQTRELVCASCEAGGQPVGNALLGGIMLAQRPEIGNQPYQSASTPFQQTRAMNDAGTRLFYNAPSSSGNSPSKIYEYEQDEEGSCGESGGCRYVLSSSGVGIDQYLGESANGNDVIFATTGPLVQGDVDALRDVYDARVGGGFESPPAESPCQGDCRALGGGPPGDPPLVGAQTGSSGNLVAPKPKRLTRAQELAKALKACPKRNARARRRCEVRARHRFALAKRRSTSQRKGNQ